MDCDQNEENIEHVHRNVLSITDLLDTKIVDHVIVRVSNRKNHNIFEIVSTNVLKVCGGEPMATFYGKIGKMICVCVLNVGRTR